MTALTYCTPRIARRDPFADFVGRFFDDNPGESVRVRLRPRSQAPEGRSWVPAVDIVETDGAYLAIADLPGLTKKDIEITVENDVLTLSGERGFEKQEGDSYRRLERSHGSFRRSFALPSDITAEKVEAKFKSGVLTVTLPKSEAAKARKIDIH